VIGVAGYFIGPGTAESEILKPVARVVGEGGAEFLERAINNFSDNRSNFLTPVISLLMLAYGSTGAFDALRNALNKIFGENLDDEHPVVGFIQSRLTALLIVFLIGVLLILSLIFSALLTLAASFIDPLLPVSITNLRLINEIVSILIIGVMLSVIYRFLPDNPPPWRCALEGAGIASLFYNLGKFLIGYYLSASNISSVYGTAGTIMLLLLWIYYSVQILLIGATFSDLKYQRSLT
jgi:membrane protein